MKEITLNLTIDEANIILNALGKRPFEEVYSLINKINQQAASQLGSNGQASVQESRQIVDAAIEEAQ